MSNILPSDITDYFKTQVIDPAVAAVAIERGTYTLTTDTPIVPKADHEVSIDSFDRVSWQGSHATVAELVDIFLLYAYNLTAIRKATVYRIDTYPTYQFTQISGTGDITSLNYNYRQNMATFQAGFSAQQSALAVAGTIEMITALVDQIAVTVTNFRNDTSSIQSIYACHNACHGSCHSSCHGACHGSRGRR